MEKTLDSDRRNLSTRITLEERYLLLEELIAELGKLKKARRIFIESNSNQRGASYKLLGQIPDMHPGVASLIADVCDLLHTDEPIVINADFDALMKEASAYAARLKRIYDRVAARKEPLSPHQSLRVHHRAHHAGISAGIPGLALRTQGRHYIPCTSGRR